MTKRFWAVVALVLFFPTHAFAQEQITDFHSYITVRKDSRLDVTEQISVIAAGNRIRHGIYRDFPTSYNVNGIVTNVGFRVLRVLRDGRSIPYSVVPLENGDRIYMGSKHVPIPPGPYTFTLSYEVDRELGFFKDHDELFWNVTGNGWGFPIDKAEADVTLPKGAKILGTKAYTGYQGAYGQDFTSGENSNIALFETTKPLAPRQGLSVAVDWPKGAVHEPTPAQKLMFFIGDNFGFVIPAAAGVLLLIYYLIVWGVVKSREPKESSFPRFEPPAGYSASAVSYIKDKGAGREQMTALIIDLAVKGYLKITKEKHLLGHDVYTLTLTGTEAGLTEIETAISNILFAGRQSLTLENSQYQVFQAASDELRWQLSFYEDGNYLENKRYIYAGWIFTIITCGSAYLFATAAARGAALLPTAATAFLNLLFPPPLKTYTQKGRDLRANIDGFKMFLSVTDRNHFAHLSPPDVTPEIFEKYLPYAVALKVESNWADKFGKQLEAAGQSISSYQPVWYGGNFTNMGQFSSGLCGGLSQAISSASSPPGGGGGGAGGGGGGGGGGGF